MNFIFSQHFPLERSKQTKSIIHTATNSAVIEMKIKE
jgi:hypothetical protein